MLRSGLHVSFTSGSVVTLMTEQFPGLSPVTAQQTPGASDVYLVITGPPVIQLPVITHTLPEQTD